MCGKHQLFIDDYLSNHHIESADVAKWNFRQSVQPAIESNWRHRSGHVLANFGDVTYRRDAQQFRIALRDSDGNGHV